MLLAHQHGLGLAFEVDVGFAAHVDGDPVDGAAGEAVRPFARVVRRDRVADVAARRHRPSPAIMNLPGWVLMRPSPTFWSPWYSERMPVATAGGSSPSLSNDADRIRFSPVGTSSVADDLLLEHADEVVHVVQSVVLDVEGVAPNREPWANSTPCAPGAGMSTSAPIVKERLRTMTACASGTSACVGK